MNTEVKLPDVNAEREMLKAKFFAYLTNPSLAEHNNVVNAMNDFEDAIAKQAAERRRKAKAPYVQQIGRAKRRPEEPRPFGYGPKE